MTLHPLAGKPAPRSLLVNVPRLISTYYSSRPDPSVPEQSVSFGTSGHRGSSLRCSFNEDHVLAIAQAICLYRAEQGIDGPLFLGMDTHALSEPAMISVLEVLAANGVETLIDEGGGYTPTPVISHAILAHNRSRSKGLGDGIVITPSHNPPEDGGIKYNPPHGGPADTAATKWIEARANEILAAGAEGVRRIPHARALAAETTHRRDYITPYVSELDQVLDMKAIAAAKLRIGADPMGGAGIAYWGPIAETYALEIDIVNEVIDPTFAFMCVDRDGRIRMDCSSPHAMAGLVGLKDRYDIAFGNDTDFDRHGIVTPSAGLLNPNHYLAVAIAYLCGQRPGWSPAAAIGKTLVSSAMIDRVAAALDRRLAEVPVGFKWFVEGLLSGDYAFGGEESAGASFLRKDGTTWTTEKDGILLDLLAVEITAHAGRDPGELYQELTERHGAPLYERISAPASSAQKAALKQLSPDQVEATELAGEKILERLTRAPANDAPIGGLKVCTANGWFAARPSGTEDIYKIYAESFTGREHLERLLEEARAIVERAFARAGV